MIESEEPSSTFPHYVWVQLPKSYILLKTVEFTKASGIFYDFFQHVESEFQKNLIRNNKLETPGFTAKQAECTDSSECVDFSDSIVAEAFVLFLYCVALSVISVTAELYGIIIIDSH